MAGHPIRIMEIIVILVIIVAIAKFFGGGRKKTNCCPKCGKDSLEQASHWWSGSYVRCKHTFLCGWNSRAAEQQRKQRQERPRPVCVRCGRANVSDHGQICSACDAYLGQLQDNQRYNGNINDDSR